MLTMTKEELLKAQERLQAEAAKIKKEALQVENELSKIEATEQNAHGELIQRNLEALLSMTPKHSSTSCSDTKFYNSTPYLNQHGCTRCMLLNIKDGMDPSEFEVTVTARYLCE